MEKKTLRQAILLLPLSSFDPSSLIAPSLQKYILVQKWPRMFLLFLEIRFPCRDIYIYINIYYANLLPGKDFKQ